MLTTIHTRGLCYAGDDGAPAFLIVHIKIECEACGEYEIVLPGHHVRALAQTLLRVAQHSPDLTPLGDVIESPMQVVTPQNN